MNKKKEFSGRGFVSIVLALCFAGLAISGVVLYFAPPCSVADRIGWTIIGLSKDQWASLHQVSALFILVLSIFHLFVYNWKTFLCYFRRKNKTDEEIQHRMFRIPKEVLLAFIVALVMYAGALTFIVPFGWLHDGSESIKEHYQTTYPAQRERGEMQEPERHLRESEDKEKKKTDSEGEPDESGVTYEEDQSGEPDEERKRRGLGQGARDGSGHEGQREDRRGSGEGRRRE
ncbi:DUF4405 domain-containing protein [Balneolaceae bacterium ANBcel3]|nr:DUF4405 domain-containing protein [Balneolaceae bacterium ANBcel3]